MKSFIFCCILATICVFVTSCYCKCDCDPNDNSCISSCVVEANTCVTSCKGNIECYENCIDDKWPSGEGSPEDMEESTPVFRDVLATTTTVYNTISAIATPATLTATVSVSNTAKQADASNSHVSSSTTLKISTTAPYLLVIYVAVMLMS